MKTKEYILGDLAEIGRGSSPRPITDEAYFKNGTIPWIKIADATASDKYIYETREHVNDFGASFSRKLKPGTLIIAASGTLGFPKFLGIEGCIHDGWMYFSDFKENIIDREYLYYYLITLRGYFNNLSYGAAIQNINTPIVKKTKVQLPPLPTQQKIASILSAYDNLIQNYKKQIEALQTAASELYKEWFVRFRFPGYQTTRFENGIPEGWKVERIGEYCNIRIGGDVPEENSETKDENHKYPIFSNGINEDGLYGFTDTFKISEPSVTISARGTVGFVCLRRDPYYPIVRLICLIPRKELGVFYLYHSLKYADLDGNGTSQQQLTAPMVSKRKIMIAEEKLIEKFNLNAKIIYDKIDLLKIQITNLTQQRDLLLPRLMSGKLEI